MKENFELIPEAAETLRRNQPELNILPNAQEVAEKAVCGVREVISTFISFVEREAEDDTNRVILGISLSTQLESEFNKLRKGCLRAGIDILIRPKK